MAMVVGIDQDKKIVVEENAVVKENNSSTLAEEGQDQDPTKEHKDMIDIKGMTGIKDMNILDQRDQKGMGMTGIVDKVEVIRVTDRKNIVNLSHTLRGRHNKCNKNSEWQFAIIKYISKQNYSKFCEECH